MSGPDRSRQDRRRARLDELRAQVRTASEEAQVLRAAIERAEGDERIAAAAAARTLRGQQSDGSGCCNTPTKALKVPHGDPPAASRRSGDDAYGVDTIKLAFELPGLSSERLADALGVCAGCGGSGHAARGPGGARLMRYAQAPGRLFIECRGQAVLDDADATGELMAPDRLGELVDVLARFITVELNANVDRAKTSIARLDLAAELRFDDRPADGLDFLRAVERLDLPRLATVGYRRPGGRSTGATWHADGQRSHVHRRVYDKAEEMRRRGHDCPEPPGARVRMERQARWDQGRRPLACDLAPGELRRLYAARLHEDGREVPDVVTLATPDAIERDLYRRAANGELAPKRYGSLILALRDVALSNALPDVPLSDSRARAVSKRRALLREHGLVVDDVGEPVAGELTRVPVGRYLTELRERFA